MLLKPLSHILLTAVLSAPLLVQAAVVVEGSLLQADGSPAAKTKVLSYGAKPSHSKANGQFKLNFPKAKVGERVLITISKPGWAIINDLEMNVLLDASKVSLPPLLIGPKETKAEAQLAYYQAQAQAVVAEHYRLYRIKKMNGAELPDDEKQALEKKRQEVLGHAERLVQQLAVWDPIEGDPILRDVFSFYLAGKLDQALKLLPEDDLFGGILADGMSEAEQRQLRINNGQALRLRGNLLLQSFQFPEAEMAYKKAELINPNTFKNWMDNADYFHQQGELEQAASYYQKAIYFAQTEQQGDAKRANPNLADAQAGLASVEHTLQHYDKAREGYLSALELRRQLAEKNPKRYKTDLAPLLFNLGMLYNDQQQYQEARQVWQEAQAIFEEAAAKDGASYAANLEVVKQALAGLPQ